MPLQSVEFKAIFVFFNELNKTNQETGWIYNKVKPNRNKQHEIQQMQTDDKQCLAHLFAYLR